MSKVSNTICQRLRSVGYKQEEVLPILNLVEKWIKNHGPEWTVTRIKTYKSMFIHLLNGTRQDPEWVAVTHRGYPRDCFGLVFRRGLKSTKPKDIVRALHALMAYSALKSTKVTPKQRKKFFDAVEKTPSKEFEEILSDLRDKVSPKYAENLKTQLRNFGLGIFNYFKDARQDNLNRWLCREGKMEPLLCNPVLYRNVKGFHYVGNGRNMMHHKHILQFQKLSKQKHAFNLMVNSTHPALSVVTSICNRTVGNPFDGYLPLSLIGHPYMKTINEGVAMLGELQKVALELGRIRLSGVDRPSHLKYCKSVKKFETTLGYTFPEVPHGNREDLESFIFGKISCIQEPGFKARFIANPSSWFQWATSRLGNAIYDYLNTIKDDYRLDQNKGAEVIRQHLKRNVRKENLHSIDLSNATDAFPWALQSYMLECACEFALRELKESQEEVEQLIIKDEIDFEKDFNEWLTRERAPFNRMINARAFLDQVYLLHRICKGQYQYKENSNEIRCVRWKAGQPLGLYASFGLFSLAHHAVMRAHEPHFYCIVGDDLVCDQVSAEKHYSVLDCLGVKYSPDKTIVGNSLAEFAGMIITKDAIMPQLKHRPVDDRNYISVARLLGPSSLKTNIFTGKQKKILRLLDVCLTTELPLALNWNTSGKPYSERYAISKYLQGRMNNNVSPRASGDWKLLKLFTEMNAYSWTLGADERISINKVKENTSSLVDKNGVDTQAPGWLKNAAYQGYDHVLTTAEMMAEKPSFNKPEFQGENSHLSYRPASKLSYR